MVTLQGDRHEVINALAQVERMVGKSSEGSVLSFVHLFTKSGFVWAEATSASGVGLLQKMPMTASGDFDVLVPGRMREAIKVVSTDEIEIVLKATTATVKAGKSKFEMNLGVGQFPSMGFDDAEWSEPFDISGLLNVTSEVGKFASKDPRQHTTSGAYLVPDGEQVWVMATDSYRAVRSVVKAEWPFGDLEHVTIPRNTIADLLKFGTGKVRIAKGNHFKIASEGLDRFYSGSIKTDKFPPIGTLMDKEIKKPISVTVDYGALKAALDGASIVAGKGSSLVVDITEDGIACTCSGPSGSAETFADAETDGKLQFAINPGMLLSVLSLFGPRTTFVMNTNTTPMVIKDGDLTAMVVLNRPPAAAPPKEDDAE